MSRNVGKWVVDEGPFLDTPLAFANTAYSTNYRQACPEPAK